MNSQALYKTINKVFSHKLLLILAVISIVVVAGSIYFEYRARQKNYLLSAETLATPKSGKAFVRFIHASSDTPDIQFPENRATK